MSYRSVFSNPRPDGYLEKKIQEFIDDWTRSKGYPFSFKLYFKRISDKDRHAAAYNTDGWIYIEEWDWTRLHPKRWMKAVAHELAHADLYRNSGVLEHTLEHELMTNKIWREVEAYFSKGY